jgi:predicted MFS family arabinose efflux permease
MLLWSGQVVTTLGAQASSIIYPLLILALTASPAQASLATALRIVPYLLLSLPVGALIDRWDRRRVMIICHVARGAAIATLPLAMAFDALTVAHIYAVAVIEGALHVFFNIAETAALPRVVDKAELPQATAQNQAGFAAATVVGPALGTWLYQVAGKGVPFVVDTITHLLGALALWRMRTSFTPAPVLKRPDLRAEVIEGLRWLWHHRLIRDMALITGGLNFLSTATPLLLIVLAKEQGASEAQIGLVFALGGLGAILGALVGGQIQRRFSFGQVIIGTIALQALLFPFYALAPGPVWLGVVYAGIMFFGPVFNVVQFSYRISMIPDGLQGRVNSGFRLICFSMNPVGAALCGLTLEWWGTTAAVAVFSAFYLALTVATWMDDVVRKAPRHAPAAPVAVDA